MRQIASFLVGVLFGAALLIAVRGHDLDHFYAKVLQLQQQNETLQEKVDDLKNQLQNQKKGSIRRVRAIEVQAKTDASVEEVVKLQIEKQMKEQLKPLLHLNTEALEDASDELVNKLLDNQKVQIGSSTYLIHFRSLFLLSSDTLRVTITCQKESPLKT